MTSDEALRKIEQWPISTNVDIRCLLDFVVMQWDTDYGSFTHELSNHEAAVIRLDEGELPYRFATGGWSENEMLIYALQRNRLLHTLAWRLSVSGGLHIYRAMKE